MQASFEVVVVSAKARGLPDGRPEVSIEENDFGSYIFGSAFLNVLYSCFSFILPHNVTETYENKGEKIELQQTFTDYVIRNSSLHGTTDCATKWYTFLACFV